MYYIHISEKLFLKQFWTKSNHCICFSFPNFVSFVYQITAEVLSKWRPIVFSRELLWKLRKLVYVKELTSQGDNIKSKRVRKGLFHSSNLPTKKNFFEGFGEVWRFWQKNYARSLKNSVSILWEPSFSGNYI